MAKVLQHKNTAPTYPPTFIKLNLPNLKAHYYPTEVLPCHPRLPPNTTACH